MSSIDLDALGVAAPQRHRTADHVFETLAAGILKGVLRPGQPLPTQRELAEKFSISPLVVRQAIHKLEDLSLVDVRQGRTTLVRDPDESTDIRLIELRMELMSSDEKGNQAVLENQVLFLVPVLQLAELRISEEQLGVLESLVGSMAATPTSAQAGGFRVKYWTLVAAATDNPIFQHQVRWYMQLGSQAQETMQSSLHLEVYRALNEALKKKSNAGQVWFEATRRLFDGSLDD